MFSKTVASCFSVFERPAQAYFCNTVNNAFDVMNSSKVYHGYNKYKCAYGINETEQHAALMEMEKLLLSMKFGNANENRQRREKMQFQKGMLCSIKGVLFLFDQLKKEGFKYLMTTKVIVSKIFYHLLRETISSFYNSFHTGKSRLL